MRGLAWACAGRMPFLMTTAGVRWQACDAWLLPFPVQEGTGRVDRLVTLGSPHNPPPPGVVDQTRGILSHIAATSPGNFHEQVQLPAASCMLLTVSVCCNRLTSTVPWPVQWAARHHTLLLGTLLYLARWAG